MDADAAIAKVDEWLRAVHEPGVVRVDTENVRLVPEGWSVPYDSVGYLDEGRSEKQIFPPPRMIVREPDGALRQASPQPGGLSIPAYLPGEENWREAVDHEYTAAGLGRLGVPHAAIRGWTRPSPDGQGNFEKYNSRYRVGPVQRGYPLPENKLETLLQFYDNRWLTRDQLLAGLGECDVVLPANHETLKVHWAYWNDERYELKVWVATKYFPGRSHACWRVDLASLNEDESHPLPNLRIVGPPGMDDQLVSGEELAESLAKFPRFAPRVSELGPCVEADPALTALSVERAGELGLAKPTGAPLVTADRARAVGFELTPDECRRAVLGNTWIDHVYWSKTPPEAPADLAANGLMPAYDNEGKVVVRRASFGKDPDQATHQSQHGWQRITGAYVGFAIGEALGSAVDGMSWPEINEKYGPGGITDFDVAFERPGQLGPLTQQLLFQTEAVIRSPHRFDDRRTDEFGPAVRTAMLRWLHTQGVPYDKLDGWLVKVPELHARRGPRPDEFAALLALSTGTPAPPLTSASALISALPAALSHGPSYGRLPGGLRETVRLLAGLTHTDETDLETTLYFADILSESLTGKDANMPVWVLGLEKANSDDPSRHGPVWAQLKTMAADTLPNFGREGDLHELTWPKDVGDGQDSVSVLGRAFASVAGLETEPERAFRRAVNHPGRSALTGALAGALLGAHGGIPGLPQQWVEKLELRYLVENLATDAARHFAQFGQPVWEERYPRW